MFTSIWQDLRYKLQTGNMIIMLIFVNILFFIVVLLAKMLLGYNPGLLDNFIEFFSANKSWWHTLTHPWGIITHMFLHEGFFHLLWNMLFLYWFGQITGDILGDRHILPVYVLSGLVGWVFFMISAYTFYAGIPNVTALGASAAVNGIILAGASVAPNYNMRLLLIGNVRLKYIAAFLIILDLVFLTESNTGGRMAHLGGAAMGWFYVWAQYNWRDLSKPINNTMSWLSNLFNRQDRHREVYRKRKQVQRQRVSVSKPTERGNRRSDTGLTADNEARLNYILEKIKREGGVSALTPEERQFLDSHSDF